MGRRRHCEYASSYMPYYHYPVRHVDLASAMGTPQMPGTILRVHIPPGMVINLLNLVEVASPQGISLIVRLPFMSGTGAYQNFVQSLTQAGAVVQPVAPTAPVAPTHPMLG